MADSATVATTRGMWLTLVAMTLASSMILVDQTAVPLASPDVVQGLGGNIADGQWILTANILPLAVFMVLGGRLGDLFGLRRVFLCGAVLFAVATALASGARSMVWMISMRAVQGTSAAMMMPTAVAITSAVWPKERRGYALGVLAGGVGVLRRARSSAGRCAHGTQLAAGVSDQRPAGARGDRA
jgi:MFS family permease